MSTQVRTCNTYNLCLDSSLYLVLFYSCIPDCFLRPFKKDRQVFNAILQETVFHICSNLPLPSTCRLTPSPTSGDGLHFVFFALPSPRRGRLTFSILSFYTHTYSFRQPGGWHLSQGKASHSLLQRRSAPRKVVRLLPVLRGQLAICILLFYGNNQVINFKNYDFFLP